MFFLLLKLDIQCELSKVMTFFFCFCKFMLSSIYSRVININFPIVIHVISWNTNELSSHFNTQRDQNINEKCLDTMDKVQKLIDFKAVNKIIQRHSRSINTNQILHAAQNETSQEPLDEGKEIRIEVPWGHIAGKWYGAETTRPILMAHGWQDNCGTFDRLIPRLPKHLSYLSFDFPGHGLSSPLPSGMIYTYIQFVSVLTHIQKHFKWDKFSFCSHSLGAQISSIYAAFFPKECDLLICIDEILNPWQSNVDYRIKLMQKSAKEFVELDALSRNGQEPPSYSLEECVDRWVKGTSESVNRETLPFLMKRGLMPSKHDPNKFYFSRDVRLRVVDFGNAITSSDNFEHIGKRITAPHLYVRANTNKFNVKRDESIGRAIDIYTKNNPKFEWFGVEAPHHLHLTHPELLSEQVSAFINKYRPKNE